MMRAALAVLALAGCTPSRADRGTLHESAETSDKVDAPATPVTVSTEPLRAEWIERLDLSTGSPAFVTPPVGATGPRPIVVAIHGAMDDPGLMCSAWRLVTDAYPFVVCPAGAPVRKDTYVWPSSDVIAKRALAAIDAVESRWPAYVTRGAPVLYVAFSQGANMAGPVLGADPKRMPRAVLTEGAYRLFDDGTSARRYHAGGGERVLLTCSQAGCAGAMAGARAGLERGGIDARVLDCGPHGHSMPPPVREAIHGALPWITDGLPGWSGYAAAPKLASH